MATSARARRGQAGPCGGRAGAGRAGREGSGGGLAEEGQNKVKIVITLYARNKIDTHV